MFVRFLIATERCAQDLEHIIPRAPGRRPSSLPKYLSPEDVERAIAACDPSTQLGARDRAIVLLLARLALRAADVADLKWWDINWPKGTIRLTGKSRREDVLPLPQDVGDAILHYVERMRPAVPSDHIFIITAAPYTPIRPRQVSQTAKRVLLRAGVQAASYGAHIFRHSVATTMLRSGASLGEIGALLRHSDSDTTAVYAKVDVDLLRQVALPWPEEVPQC
jgi:site-specific recombinase XerD